MRLARLLVAFAASTSTLTLLAAAPAAAQQTEAATAAPTQCIGNLNIVRVSDIKPGMMAKFLQAVVAQRAWYKNAGAPDQIDVMRIMELDPTTKVYAFSETQAITNHIEPAARGKAPVHDPGFDAFVAMFKESSTIKTEYVTCMATM